MGVMDSLVSRAASGDEQAFAELFARHAMPLTLFLQRQAGGTLQADCGAEDLLQVVAWKAWEQLAEFREQEPGAFYRWLLQIARNVIGNRIHYLRAKDRGRAVQLPFDTGSRGASQILLDAMTTIASRVGKQEQIAKLLAALQQLPEPQRRVVELAYLEGNPLREVGRQLGLATTTTFEHLQRALAVLRQQIDTSV